jgi:hypothetical protein
MNCKVLSVAIAVEEEELPSREADTHGKCRAIALAAFAVVLVSACNSKNPDSLIGMNIDENAVMMDANATADGNATGADSGESQNVWVSNSSDGLANAAAGAKGRARGDLSGQEHSAEANATGTEPGNLSTQTDANEVTNDNQPPG